MYSTVFLCLFIVSLDFWALLRNHCNSLNKTNSNSLHNDCFSLACEQALCVGESREVTREEEFARRLVSRVLFVLRVWVF